MPTRIFFVNGQDTTVAENEADVVAAVRRDAPNPVKLEDLAGLVMYVNWAHVTFIEPKPAPALP